MAKKPTVPAEETAVHDAAQAFHDAIAAAEKAGYRVYWPAHFRDLPNISVIETAKVERTRVQPVAQAKPEDLIKSGTVVSEVRTQIPGAAQPTTLVEKIVETPVKEK